MKETIIKWLGYGLAIISALTLVATFIVDEIGGISDNFAVITEFISGTLIPVFATMDKWVKFIKDKLSK